MRIGVIGGDGFVGGAICEELSHRCVSITRENYGTHYGKKFDVLINANGNSCKWQANDNPQSDFATNVQSVHDTMFDFKFKKYIYISSCDAKIKNSSYGLHKRMAEEIIEHYVDLFDCLILRCPIIIGKNMKKGFLYDALHDIPLYVNKDSEYQIITNTALAERIKKAITKKEYSVQHIGSCDTLRVGDLSVLLGKKIAYRKGAKREDYSWAVRWTDNEYVMKSAAEYIKDVI